MTHGSISATRPRVHAPTQTTCLSSSHSANFAWELPHGQSLWCRSKQDTVLACRILVGETTVPVEYGGGGSVFTRGGVSEASEGRGVAGIGGRGDNSPTKQEPPSGSWGQMFCRAGVAV